MRAPRARFFRASQQDRNARRSRKPSRDNRLANRNESRSKDRSGPKVRSFPAPRRPDLSRFRVRFRSFRGKGYGGGSTLHKIKHFPGVPRSRLRGRSSAIYSLYSPLQRKDRRKKQESARVFRARAP